MEITDDESLLLIWYCYNRTLDGVVCSLTYLLKLPSKVF